MSMTQDELGNWYDDGVEGDNFNDFNPTPITRAGASESVFDPTYGGKYSEVTPTAQDTGTVKKFLNSTFGGSDGVKTAGAVAGALAGAMGATSPSRKRSGYQGGIPQLQAVRNMVTAPPTANYRPGQGGVNWGGDVSYVPKGTVPTGPGGTITANDIAAANAARANASAAASKKNSTLDAFTKIAGTAGITALLSKVLGGNVDSKKLANFVDSGGKLTTAGINALTNAFKTTPAGGATAGGAKPGGVAGGTPAGGTRGIGGAGGADTGAEGEEGLTTPEGEYAGEDEFSGIDEQVAANENDLETPNVLTDEEVDAELDRINAETDAEFGTGVDDTVVNYDADQGLTRSFDGGNTDIFAGGGDDGFYDYTNDMSDVDYGDVDYSGFDFGSNDLDLSEFDLGGGDDFSLDFGDYAKGGVINMAKGRYLRGNTDGMADKLPARIGQKQPAALSHGEFVVPADVVSHLGNGNSDAGAKKLYQMMDKIRVARTGNKKQGKQINPDKFMPGGLAQAYAQGGGVRRFVEGGTTGTTGTAAAINAGVTGSETNPNTWAGGYMSDLLGKTQALTEAPYQQYMGPLTAGASPLQQKTFEGLQSVNFPSNLGQSFSSTGAPTIGADGKPVGGSGIASQYMNPYLQNVLDPQLAELRRQSQINLQPGLTKLTQAGGFGGSRQAIMESEANRNLLEEQNKTVGQGYANAYDKAMGQFNTEQGQAKTLVDMFGTQGGNQRTIEAEGIAADKAAFEEARKNPFKMLEFQQSMLSGMPISASSYDISDPSKLVSASQGAVTVSQFLKNLGLS